MYKDIPSADEIREEVAEAIKLRKTNEINMQLSEVISFVKRGEVDMGFRLFSNTIKILVDKGYKVTPTSFQGKYHVTV